MNKAKLLLISLPLMAAGAMLVIAGKMKGKVKRKK